MRDSAAVLRRSLKNHGMFVLLYAASAVACTWPLARQLYTHLPLGSLPSPTVPLFNLWTLEWNVHSLLRGYRGYWDAPIFYPTRGSFALSETQALTGAVFALLRPVFGSVAGYNLILLANLVLNAFGARRFARLLGVTPLSAALTGLLALGLPFVWKELGVLQLTALWPLWFAFAELALLSRAAHQPEPPPSSAWVRLALCCAAALWTCSYYALFFAVVALLWAALFLRPQLLKARNQRAGFAAGCVLLIAFALPLLASQPELMRGYARSAKTIHDGSATARGYTRLPLDALGGVLLPALAGISGKRSLAPGFVVSALALYGAWAGAGKGKLRRRFAVWLGVSLCSALVLSFGSRWSIGAWSPYESIVERYWPGFSHVRSPYRFAALVQSFTLAFAALGLDALRERLTTARASLPLIAAGLLALLEVVPFGARLAPFPSEALRAPWLRYLQQNPGGAVVMIPPALSGEAVAYEPTTVAMLQGLRHGHPLLNGYSGFFPKQADALDALRQFPNARSRRLLVRLQPRYAVIDKRWLAARAASELAPLTLVFDGAEQAVYRLP